MKKKTSAAAVIEGMIDGVVLTDLDGRIMQVNTASLNMYGHKREEVIGKPITEFITGEDVPKVLEMGAKSLGTGKVIRNVEFTGVRKDGSRFPVLINGSELTDEKGEPEQLIIVYRNITELKRAREELEAKNKELEEFHVLVVGRELKMKQMEAELKRLKAELGEK